MGTADSSYSLYGLTEEHQLLRQAVRELVDDKIAPRAAEIDETAEYPWDVHEALKKADLLAIHVPEEYGGAGADRIAHSIVVEEIARACASSSLIVAGNKLGTMGLILSGSDELKKTYPRRSRPARRRSPTQRPSVKPARTLRRYAPAPCATATAGS